MKKIAQVTVMSLMLTALFTSMNTPAIAGLNGPIAASPAPMPMCAPDDPNCKHGSIWDVAGVSASPAPMPMCAPDDPNCKHGSIWD